MTFFDLLRKILFKSNSLSGEDDISNFSTYMLNRWVSFYDRPKALFINETLNKYHSIFESINDLFDLYYNLIPASKTKKISYVKKAKTENNGDDKQREKDYTIIARNNNISVREIKQYIDLYRK